MQAIISKRVRSAAYFLIVFYKMKFGVLVRTGAHWFVPLSWDFLWSKGNEYFLYQIMLVATVARKRTNKIGYHLLTRLVCHCVNRIEAPGRQFKVMENKSGITD